MGRFNRSDEGGEPTVVLLNPMFEDGDEKCVCVTFNGIWVIKPGGVPMGKDCWSMKVGGGGGV